MEEKSINNVKKKLIDKTAILDVRETFLLEINKINGTTENEH